MHIIHSFVVSHILHVHFFYMCDAKYEYIISMRPTLWTKTCVICVENINHAYSIFITSCTLYIQNYIMCILYIHCNMCGKYTSCIPSCILHIYYIFIYCITHSFIVAHMLHAHFFTCVMQYINI